MKKLLSLLLLSAFLLSSCTQADDWQQLAENKTKLQLYNKVPEDFIPRKITVVSAGDSLTEGIGDSKEMGGYLPYLKTRLESEKGIKEVQFFNYGIKGNRTTQLLKRLESNKIKSKLKKADMIILTIGGNDIMKVVTDNLSNLQMSVFEREKGKYITHLTRIMHFITQQNPQASVVLIGLYNPFEEWFSGIGELQKVVTDWNAAGRNVTAGFPNAYFIPIEDLFANGGEKLLYKDHFHPNDKGYELIAERMFEQLEMNALPALAKRYTERKEEN